MLQRKAGRSDIYAKTFRDFHPTRFPVFFDVATAKFRSITSLKSPICPKVDT